MQMRQGPAGIIRCPVNTVQEVKFLSSNACQTDCGIKETSDLLCGKCICDQICLLLIISDSVSFLSSVKAKS